MPGLVSCLADLIVTGFIIFFCEPVTSEIWTNEVSDVQFGRLGSRVTLTCGGPHTGSPVEWRFNGSSVPPGQTHEGSLMLLNTTHSMEGNYSCHDERGTLLQSIKLHLGHLPSFVSISCRVPSHKKITCSWVQTKTTNLPTSYRASYSLRGSDPRRTSSEHCNQTDIRVNECTITNPPFWSSRVLVNITEINPLGFKSTIFEIDPHEQLKPDPPEDIRVSQVEGEPTQLVVQWNCPPSWPADIKAAFPLTYLLRYRPMGSNYWSMLETEEDTSLKITDALVGHLHQIQIKAQDALINYSQWSEWSHMVEAKPWTEPPEEPTKEPVDYIFPYESYPVRTTDKSPDPTLNENGSLGLLVLLGLFAAVMVAVLLTIIALLWVRQRKQDNVKKQELTSMVKMKSIPI